MSCKHRNIKLYDEGHRCMECFDEFVPKWQLNASRSELNHLRSEVASLIQEEFDNYAPDNPPIEKNEFLEALEEVCSE